MTDIDDLLYECAAGGAEQWLDSIPKEAFHPSLAFRLKMRRLLREQRAPAAPSHLVRRRPRLRRAALICVLLLICMQLMGVLSLGAICERFIQVITIVQEELTGFVYTSSGGGDDVFVPLVPGYLPEGMKEVEREETDSDLYALYQDADDHYVWIDQTFISESTQSTLIQDTEDAYFETYILNGIEVFYVEKEERRSLLYLRGSIRVSISGNIPKNEIEKIASSLKK